MRHEIDTYEEMDGDSEWNGAQAQRSNGFTALMLAVLAFAIHCARGWPLRFRSPR